MPLINMRDAMATLRGVHVLSVTQYEEKISRFRLGLCSLRAKGFK